MTKYIHQIAAVALVIGVASCKKVDFGDFNTNPDPQANIFPNTAYLLTNALDNSASSGFTAGTIIGPDIFNTETALYVQYLSQSQYPEPSLYSTTQAGWNEWYPVALEDLYTIIKYNTDGAFAADARVTANGSNKNQIAIARILKARLFSIVTDRWGDVPYFQALSGNNTPVYDKQADIYNDLLKELKEAVAQFDGGAIAKGDNMFGGDVAKWKKYANSMRMNLAMRLVKANPTLAKEQFLAAYTDPAGFITTNADNAKYVYLNNTNYCNPWNNLFNARDDYGVSNTLVDFLNTNSDPRIAVFAQKNSSGNYVGIPYGLNRAALTNFTTDYSRMGDKISGWKFTGSLPALVTYKGADGYFFTASQAWLLKAEAEARGWVGVAADAVTSYSQAVRLSWEQWGITFTNTDLTTYLARTAITPTTNIMAKIGQQKWLTLYPNGHEAWSEWRRTGYPALTPTPYAVNVSKQIPRRYAYPATEIQYNSTNYKAAVSSIGADTHDMRVWWDK